jgi:hypothetical protein
MITDIGFIIALYVVVRLAEMIADKSNYGFVKLLAAVATFLVIVFSADLAMHSASLSNTLQGVGNG